MSALASVRLEPRVDVGMLPPGTVSFEAPIARVSCRAEAYRDVVTRGRS